VLVALVEALVMPILRVQQVAEHMGKETLADQLLPAEIK
jgi:hypothetical protein